MIDALVELGKAVRGNISLSKFKVLYSVHDHIGFPGTHGRWAASGTLNSFKDASYMLFEAFKNIREDIFKEEHLAPLKSLGNFCWVSAESSLSFNGAYHLSHKMDKFHYLRELDMRPIDSSAFVFNISSSFGHLRHRGSGRN